MSASWSRKDLLGLEELSTAEITLLLNGAARAKKEFLSGARSDELRGSVLALVFNEPSTRTRSSFEIAARRLGMEVLGFSVSDSSALKGESLSDTLLTLEAMGVGFFAVRHERAGAPWDAAAAVRGHVLNAGDGAHEHPTQALSDLLALRERKGRVAGLKVVFVGDIAHSRVARSNAWALKKLGAKVAVCGPATLIPAGVESWGVSVSNDLDRALEGADAVCALRLQLERQKENLVPSLGEYYELYGLTAARLARAKEGCLVLHPGPMNRGVEISSEVADGPQSAVLEQVTNGVAVRMAALRLLAASAATAASPRAAARRPA